MNAALLSSWFRSLTVQGSWNYERMVGLGVAFTMEPLVRGLPRASAALARTAQFFNAHPYLTGLAAGALARAEREGRPPEQIDRLRSALVSSLGSVGDKLVWAGWLPLASALGLTVAVIVAPLAGVAVFLGLYNVLHFLLRWWGTVVGWREGFRVAAALGAGSIQFGLRWAGPAAGAAMGLALPIVGAWLAMTFAPPLRIGVLVVCAAGVVVGRWLFPALGGTRAGMAMVALAAVVALLWR